MESRCHCWDNWVVIADVHVEASVVVADAGIVVEDDSTQPVVVVQMRTLGVWDAGAVRGWLLARDWMGQEQWSAVGTFDAGVAICHFGLA